MVCAMADVLGECLQPIPDRICIPCCELELGEQLDDLRIRTGMGWTKNRYAKWQIDNFMALEAVKRRTSRGRAIGE